MSEEEINQYFSNEHYKNGIVSLRLILASFISMGIWVWIFEMGWMFFFFMQSSQTVPCNLPGAYQFFDGRFRHGILIFMLSISIGIIYPLLSIMINKSKESVPLIAFSGIFLGAIIFYVGAVNIPELVELKSPLLLLFYGAALGYISALISHMFSLDALSGRLSIYGP
jgi:hypothetical protein